jgi:hypothetical protein
MKQYKLFTKSTYGLNHENYPFDSVTIKSDNNIYTWFSDDNMDSYNKELTFTDWVGPVLWDQRLCLCATNLESEITKEITKCWKKSKPGKIVKKREVINDNSYK